MFKLETYSRLFDNPAKWVGDNFLTILYDFTIGVQLERILHSIDSNI